VLFRSMNDSQQLSFAEFLADLRGVVASPGRRFQAIHERGALWGSLLLLLGPAYLALPYLSGIYFDRDPFPGYSFIPPLIGASVLTACKLFGIHLVARLFEGKWRYRAGTGKMRDLGVVFGYTGLPSIIALLIAITLFLAVPAQMAALFRNFRVVAISVLVAGGIALFIWNLILMVLALRTVYAIRDIKLVVAVILGPILAGIPFLGTMLAVSSVHIDLPMAAPILNERVVRFVSSDSESQEPGRAKISIHTDLLVYRLKDPKRSDIVAFSPLGTGHDAEHRGGRRVIFGTHLWFSETMRNQMAGRIVGLPGDEVELKQGMLRINGQLWQEPYIAPDYQSDLAIPAVKLGPSDYLVLPEDRRLLDAHRNELVVSRSRITGRLIVNRLPLGWVLFRPTAFLHANPLS
jgi:hypothetical protein